ncbi:hypothetical protein [Streptomyces sp. A012304]|uniref:hypothetical protein n=1 Tax=Streptomyces sp. A012304 TaxID=375446 RepID=UPI00222F301A|nr:hypothetical protein [Streptomyces sp. A012304]GKQ36858.1 lipoprotein [Streptomyces sp. A012304]
MPYPPPRARSGPRRRTVLASAAGAALLVGCSSGGDTGSGSGGSGEGSADAGRSAARAARARAARDSGGLVERYDVVLAAYPQLAPRLGPLRAEVVRHVEAFGDTGGTPGTGGTSSAPSPSATASSSAPSVTAPAPAAAPPTEKEALAQLATAERALADRRVAALADVPGELARLLASVAAAGAAHAYLLTEGAR